MKPLLIEWIPFYGMFKYFKRYFKADKRGSREAYIALWFELYHMVTSLVIIMPFVIKLIYLCGK